MSLPHAMPRHYPGRHEGSSRTPLPAAVAKTSRKVGRRLLVVAAIGGLAEAVSLTHSYDIAPKRQPVPVESAVSNILQPEALNIAGAVARYSLSPQVSSDGRSYELNFARYRPDSKSQTPARFIAQITLANSDLSQLINTVTKIDLVEQVRDAESGLTYDQLHITMDKNTYGMWSGSMAYYTDGAGPTSVLHSVSTDSIVQPAPGLLDDSRQAHAVSIVADAQATFDPVLSQ